MRYLTAFLLLFIAIDLPTCQKQICSKDNWKVLMFEKNNPEDMILTIKKALGDFDSLNAIALEAIQLAEDYNTSVMADRFYQNV